VPLIQIAAVTGIPGITFIVLFIPSAIALAWYYRGNLRKLKYISGVSLGLIGGLFLYGFIRLASPSPASKIKVGLAVLDENVHSNSDHPAYPQEKKVTLAYAKQIATLASKGAQLVLLPERAIGLDSRWADSLKSVLSAVAKKNHVFIIIGNTNVSGKQERNSALVFDQNGNVLVNYTKKHLIPGLESQFIPGKQIGLFGFNGLRAGIAICKDMDFPGYIRQYGAHNLQVLFVPAWDFVVDDWLHSRMAILRSVENGFSQVRCARKGGLTINDPYGRVTFETSSANEKSACLIGTISPEFCRTLYTRTGDWFGPLNLVAAFMLVVLGFAKPKKAIVS
jgi:apolipoprotein N-acyltransferase